MYCAFYGIQEKPFSITPDPKFLFLGATHKEAFAHLVYGIRERGGFITITGEIGTGKTTLCRALLSHLDPNTLVAFILNPTLSAIELLKSINEDFGIPSGGNTRKDLIDELNRFLLEKRKGGKNTVLIIDEAQNLDREVLEHIRLLSNLETDTEKLLQIVLIGQPEFRKILAQPSLQQLNQRVTVRYHLQPLSREETSAYIRHRLSVVGAEDRIRFTDQALKKIYRHTEGVPRLINVLCDRCLLAGYSLGKKEIDGAIVDRSRREVACDEEPGGVWSWIRLLRRGLLPGFLLAATVILAVYGMYAITVDRPGAMTPRAERRSLELNRKSGRGGPFSHPLRERKTPSAAVKETVRLGADKPSDSQAETTDAAPALDAGSAQTAEAAPLPPEKPQKIVDASMEEILVLSLAERTILQTRKQALAAVLARWDLLPGDPKARERVLSLDIYQAANVLGLQCARFQGNMDRIRSLNVPVVLEMRVGQNPEKRFVAILGMDETKAKIDPPLRDGSEVVPAELLEKFWSGTAYVLWRDPVGGEVFLREGMRGTTVLWLQNSLRELGFYDGKATGTFDPATGRAVRAFQAGHHLEEDGILGPQTRILLYHRLKASEMPHLSGSS